MSFNIDELMTGVGIVIDDAISTDKDNKDDIFKIISKIEEKKIPIVKYSDIPDTSISNFKNVSFILLDWNLNKLTSDATEPISIPVGLEKSNIKQNIKFIKKIKETCFMPLFIFTKENTDEIIQILEDENLYSRNQHNFIFVENKSKLKNKNSLFAKVTKWLKETSSIYALKEWEYTLNKAKNELFWEFYNLNPDWPKVLWNAYKADNVDMSTEIGELISKNLFARMVSFNFDSKLLDKKIKASDKEDFKKVLEGERFIKTNDKNKIHTGDIYKKNGKYYLNLRPQCDCIPRDGKQIDDIDVYCIEGTILSGEKLIELFDKKYGLLAENYANTIVFPIDGGKAIDFRFKKFKIFKYKEIKNKRLGFLIPPYLTKIQQKYSAYLNRPGLSRLPTNVINGK